MKKLLTLFLLAATFAVPSLATAEQLSGTNIVGILAINVGQNTEALISVPWIEPGLTDETPIAVTNVIMTGNLNAGDQLCYYNTDTTNYWVWVLNSAKQWEAANNITVGRTSGTADSTKTPSTLTRGNCIYLNRVGEGTKADLIYLYGRATPKTASTACAANAYTLLASPLDDVTDLNACTWEGDINDGDRIQVPTVKSGVQVFKILKYDSYYGWGVQKVGSFSTDSAKIAVGCGVWYVSKGGSPTITWTQTTK